MKTQFLSSKSPNLPTKTSKPPDLGTSLTNISQKIQQLQQELSSLSSKPLPPHLHQTNHQKPPSHQNPQHHQPKSSMTFQPDENSHLHASTALHSMIHSKAHSKLSQRVPAPCFQDLLSKSINEAMSQPARVHNRPHPKLPDLTEDPKTCDPAFKDEIAHLKALFNMFTKSGSHNNATSLSIARFKKLLTDCHVIKAGNDSFAQDVELAFLAHTKHKQHIDFIGFLGLLPKVAVMRYKFQEYLPEEALGRMLQAHLLPLYHKLHNKTDFSNRSMTSFHVDNDAKRNVNKHKSSINNHNNTTTKDETKNTNMNTFNISEENSPQLSDHSGSNETHSKPPSLRKLSDEDAMEMLNALTVGKTHGRGIEMLVESIEDHPFKTLFESLTEPDMVNFVRVMHSGLIDYYVFYADFNGLMTLENFMKFAKDFELVPKTLPEDTVISVFSFLAAIYQYVRQLAFEDKFYNKNQSGSNRINVKLVTPDSPGAGIDQNLFAEAIALCALEGYKHDKDATNIIKIYKLLREMLQSNGASEVHNLLGLTRSGHLGPEELLTRLREKFPHVKQLTTRPKFL